MKIWLRGKDYDVHGGKGLQYFPISADRFHENNLIVHRELRAEGFPTAWGAASAFGVRLSHSLQGDEQDAAYRRQCAEAAGHLLTLIVAQFLGLVRADSVALVEPAEDGSEQTVSSPLLRLLRDSLVAEKRPVDRLVVLRDHRRTRSPIAAVNHPDCLWFPVHSYPMEALAQDVERLLGRVEPGRITLNPALTEEEVKPLVAQLRGYIDHLWQRSAQGSAVQRILAEFERTLAPLAEKSEVAIRSGSAYGWTGKHLREVELFRAGGLEEVGPGCTTCGRGWMNHRYDKEPGGRLILRGGPDRRRDVQCPLHGTVIDGWRDLHERSVFFDEDAQEYVIWADDPNDEGSRALQLPPDAERLDVQRGTDGRGWARFRFNQAEIEVHGRVVYRREVLLGRVMALPHASQATVLPFNAEQARCIQWGAGGLVADPAHRGSWTAHLRGGWKPFQHQVQSFQEAVAAERLTVLLWPGLQESGWKAETAVLASSDGALQQPVVRFYRPSGEGGTERWVELRGGDIHESLKPLGFHPEYLELRSAAGEPWGVLEPKRTPPLQARTAQAVVGLDFGTSNTVVALHNADIDFEAVAMDGGPAPVEIFAPTTLDEKERVAARHSLPPFWPARRPGRWCISSELLSNRSREVWTIPHDAVDPSRFGEIHRDFKWQDPQNVLRKQYLGLVLEMAMANLKARGIETVDLRATYPLAFEQHQLSEYAAVIQELVEDLKARSGLQIQLGGFCNESISALEACGMKAGNLHCVVDLGGGTTDIAVRVPGEEKPLFVESLRLAGNDVLDSLLADPLLVDALVRYGAAPSMARDAEVVARQIMLRDLRSSANGEAPRFWNRLASVQATAAERFSARNRALFDGVLAYLVKLLDRAEALIGENGPAGERKPMEASVFLVGQGWGLLRLQKGRGDHAPEAYVSQRLESLRELFGGGRGSYTVHVLQPPLGSPKEATSKGVVQIPRDLVRPALELQKHAGRNTILGLDVRFHDGSELAAHQMLEESGSFPRTNAAVDTHTAWSDFVQPLLEAPGVTEHVRERFGPTDEERRRLVDFRLNDLIDKAMGAQLAKGEPQTTSPLRLLIEHVWAERLRRVTP